VITLCEVKFRERPGVEVIGKVARKVDALSALGPHTIERVLISAYPPSQELEDEGYFSRILTAEDLAEA
jgi:hypothetical protein